MLIAKRNLEVVHLLSVALKPKMTRLDNAGVHGADSDFVNLLAFDPVKITDTRKNRLARRAIPGILSRPRPRVSYWLKPRMPRRLEAELFGDLTLEEMHLRATRRERGKRVARYRRAPDDELIPTIVREDGKYVDDPLLRRRRAEVRAHALTRVDFLNDGGRERRELERDERGKLQCLTVECFLHN